MEGHLLSEPTFAVIRLSAVASFERAVPLGGVVRPPVHHLLPHPGRAVPPAGPARLLEHPPHDAEPSSVRQRRPGAYV